MFVSAAGLGAYGSQVGAPLHLLLWALGSRVEGLGFRAQGLGFAARDVGKELWAVLLRDPKPQPPIL